MAFNATITKIKDAPLLAFASAQALMLTTGSAMAEATEGADVRGALETNQQAMEAVQDSTFTEEGVQSGSQAITNAVLYGVGAIGIILTAFGIYQLWKHSKEGDRAQGNAGQGIAMIAIGGLMTIAAIATAVVPNLVVGDGG